MENDVKKTLYEKLIIIQVNPADNKITRTYGLVTKIQYDLDKQGPEMKIEDIYKIITNASGLNKEAYYNTKITDIEKKIRNVTGFMTTAAVIQKPLKDWKQNNW